MSEWNGFQISSKCSLYRDNRWFMILFGLWFLRNFNKKSQVRHVTNSQQNFRCYFLKEGSKITGKLFVCWKTNFEKTMILYMTIPNHRAYLSITNSTIMIHRICNSLGLIFPHSLMFELNLKELFSLKILHQIASTSYIFEKFSRT